MTSVPGTAARSRPRIVARFVATCWITAGAWAWMHDGSSLYDHFGQGFTLLVTDDGDTTGSDAIRAAATAAGVPLTVVRPREPGIAELYKANYALIRPDQHVAWRSNTVGDAAAIFRKIAGQQIAEPAVADSR